MIELKLDGNVAIITGSGRGLGREFALSFAKEGAKLVIAELVFENGQRVADEIRAIGGESIAVRTDVSDEKSIEETVRKTVETYGRIDALVNNAAMFYGVKPTPAEDLKPEDWDRMLRVNVTGQWLCARAVFPYMKKNGRGKIINISSDIIWSGATGLLHYTASKGAVMALTMGLASEWGQYNINVNSVAPGLTMTEAGLKFAEATPDVGERTVARQCLKRLEQPGDLAGIVVFLASADSDFITGQNICVNGGQVRR